MTQEELEQTRRDANANKLIDPVRVVRLLQHIGYQDEHLKTYRSKMVGALAECGTETTEIELARDRARFFARGRKRALRNYRDMVKSLFSELKWNGSWRKRTTNELEKIKEKLREANRLIDRDKRGRDLAIKVQHNLRQDLEQKLAASEAKVATLHRRVSDTAESLADRLAKLEAVAAAARATPDDWQTAAVAGALQRLDEAVK